MYLENGVMAERYDYSDLKKKYGDIVSTSADGLNFILKKKNRLSAAVFKLDLSGLNLIRNIEVTHLLKAYTHSHHPHFSGDHQWFHNAKHCNYKFQINND